MALKFFLHIIILSFVGMADSIQDDDEMNMENHMEKIRLAVSSYEIDQFSNKLQRNMMVS